MDVVCKNCGKKFKSPRSKAKFCSTECFRQWMKTVKTIKKQNSHYQIALIGHLGAGSMYGILPKGGYTIPDRDDGGLSGVHIDPSPQQKMLREYFEDAKQKIGIPYIYPNVLVIGGEPTEGINPKGFAEDICIPRLEDQIEIAIQIIKEFVGKETEEVLLTYSHTYHGTGLIRLEKIIARRLRAEGINAKASPIFIRTYFDKTIRFRHGSTGAFVYKATERERTIKFNLQELALGKTIPIDCDYIFHTHRDVSARFERFVATSIGCFKLMDTYAKFRHPDAWLPDIGMTILNFNKAYGKIWIDERPLRYYPLTTLDELLEAQRIWNESKLGQQILKEWKLQDGRTKQKQKNQKKIDSLLSKGYRRVK